LPANKSVLQAKARQKRERPKGTRVTGKSGVTGGSKSAGAMQKKQRKVV